MPPGRLVVDGLGEVASLILIKDQHKLNNTDRSKKVPTCNISLSWSVGAKIGRPGGLLGRLRCARVLFLPRGSIIQKRIRIAKRTATAAPATETMTVFKGLCRMSFFITIPIFIERREALKYVNKPNCFFTGRAGH